MVQDAANLSNQTWCYLLVVASTNSTSYVIDHLLSLLGTCRYWATSPLLPYYYCGHYDCLVLRFASVDVSSLCVDSHFCYGFCSWILFYPYSAPPSNRDGDDSFACDVFCRHSASQCHSFCDSSHSCPSYHYRYHSNSNYYHCCYYCYYYST
jgi:hypothetical protein